MMQLETIIGGKVWIVSINGSAKIQYVSTSERLKALSYFLSSGMLAVSIRFSSFLYQKSFFDLS